MEQIYITEDNIVKYDEIVVCQVGLPDKENLVQYEELSLLNDVVKDKIEEVLEGVGLKERNSSRRELGMLGVKEEASPIDVDSKFNQFVHLNTVDQKIFTSLLSPRRETRN